MATISNTPRPGYVWDVTDNVWYPIGVGGHAHPDYITQATAVNPTLIDAKGDIITATAADTPARLAVGNNGETLVANSAASTGLQYNANFSAGKNAIINGNYDVFQRGTSVTVPTATETFLADRYVVACTYSAGTASLSRQTFTPGTAPVAGQEATFFQRLTAGTTNTYFDWTQKIENVRTFAGLSTTFSFYAKASASTNVSIIVRQNFGSGGSANVDTSSAITLTTSWQRFTLNVNNLGSMSGKTIGTNSYLMFGMYLTGSLGSGVTIDSWGWQVEASSVATQFQTATGTLQGELAACQRYYERWTPEAGNFAFAGFNNSTTSAYHTWHYHVKKRTSATVSVSAATDFSVRTPGGNQTCSAFSLIGQTTDGAWLNTTSVSLGSGDGNLLVNSGASPYIQADAEL